MAVSWQVFPRSTTAHATALLVVDAFNGCYGKVGSAEFKLESNAVLCSVADQLAASGFQVETGKTRLGKISVPVLFGRNGTVDKAFEADAFHPADGVVVEVEAGRGVVNNQFLKDLFEACMMHNAKHLVICVRLDYRGSNDFEKVCRFMETLYASDRLSLPLDTVMIIGY